MVGVKDEFLGKKIIITKSPMSNQLGVEGLIVDETKYTFLILTGAGEKKVLKSKREFLICGTKIVGDKILKRPEERIKIKEK
jgi:RNase P/RNase MRP subunit p29